MQGRLSLEAWLATKDTEYLPWCRWKWLRSPCSVSCNWTAQTPVSGTPVWSVHVCRRIYHWSEKSRLSLLFLLRMAGLLYGNRKIVYSGNRTNWSFNLGHLAICQSEVGARLGHKTNSLAFQIYVLIGKYTCLLYPFLVFFTSFLPISSRSPSFAVLCGYHVDILLTLFIMQSATAHKLYPPVLSFNIFLRLSSFMLTADSSCCFNKLFKMIRFTYCSVRRTIVRHRRSK